MADGGSTRQECKAGFRGGTIYAVVPDPALAPFSAPMSLGGGVKVLNVAV